MLSLPVIDFSPFLDPKSSAKQKLCTALQIDHACREIGFFYLKNHGIPLHLVAEMLEKGRQFIETAPQHEKESLARKPAGVGNGDSARGYVKCDSKMRGSHEVRWRSIIKGPASDAFSRQLICFVQLRILDLLTPPAVALINGLPLHRISDTCQRHTLIASSSSALPL